MSKQAQYEPDFSRFPEPNVFIQWKGTDLCCDFHCECGAHRHIDADFVYAIECDACGAVYQMPHTVALVKVEKTEDLCVHVTRPDEDD